MKKRIMVLANKYPNKFEPTACMFIQQLAWQFADMGYDCDVVSPMPVNFNIHYLSLPFCSAEKTENGNVVNIFRPKYISLGQTGKVFQKKRVLFTTKMYELAVEKVIKETNIVPDFIYAYFLCPTAVVASRFGLKYHVPAFMEHGEGIYEGNEKYGNAYLKKALQGLKGVVAVSSQNKGYMVDNNIVNENIVVIHPNCYREERFYRIDKKEARKHFNWPEDIFIVGYAGRMDHFKGSLRLQSTVDQLTDVYLACAGSGDEVPTSPKCIWAKPILHDELIYFYNALDVFVLPTLVEGSCTATAEAIGCGCPIVSSDRPFNENLCDSDNSIVVDPENIDEIAMAIEEIHANPEMKEKMSAASLMKAETLKQGRRMREIAAFMESKSIQN